MTESKSIGPNYETEALWLREVMMSQAETIKILEAALEQIKSWASSDSCWYFAANGALEQLAERRK